MRQGKARVHRNYGFIIGFLAVPVLLYAVFVISPFLQAFYISLTDWSGFTAGKNFVGLRNYDKMIHDDVFWIALRNNVVILALLPVVTIALGLFFSFMLNVGGRRRNGAAVSGVRGSAFYKVVFFFPQVLSITIIAVLWQFIYNPNSGALNSALSALGLGFLKQSWLADPNLALGSLLAVMVWANVGFYVVLFSAAMGSIPTEIYEAVTLDGASRLTTFFRITFPLIWDTVQTGWVYLGIIAMDGFIYVGLMTTGPGGPDHATTVIAYYLYTMAFENSQAGYATAMGVAMLVVTLLFAGLMSRLSRRERIEF
jgi:N-acetylglucosamine transport system permease protein